MILNSSVNRRGAQHRLLTIGLAILAFLSAGGKLDAQEPAAAIAPLLGRVEHNGTPVPSAPVTLHRVTPEASGEVAQTVTNANGEFRFPLETVSGSAFTVFFVTADYLSVRYFGQPIHPDEPRPADYTVMVYDTTSVLADPVRMVRRDMVIIPEETGSWEVNEVISILNPGTAALVASSGMPTWEFRIPEGAGEFQAGEGDILPHEVNLMDDRVLLLTPVTPGERDLFIRYRLPARPAEATFPLNAQVDTLNLFVQQPSHLQSVEGLTSTRMVEAEGQQFLQYSGTGLAPGTNLVLTWAAGDAPPIDPRYAAVGVTILLLMAGVWAALRNKRTVAA